MLFTKKMILILMCLCVMIKFNQAQEPTTLFECTFNNDLSGDCSFNVSTLLGVPNDALYTDAGEELNINATSPPYRPLSDATSVFSLTKSNGTCAFPSEINGWNLYFCATVEGTKNYTCRTSSNDTQECANGSYAYVPVNKVEGHSEIFTSHEISNSPPAEYQCLIFYYFFTNNQADAYIRVIGRNSSSEDSPIVTVIPQLESKWYTSEVSFTAPYANYRLVFEFFRDHDSSDTDPFFFAIDDISVKTGPCANDPITTTESSTTMSTTMSEGTTTTSDTLTNTTAGPDGSTTTNPSQTTSTPKTDKTTAMSGTSTTAGDMGNTTLSSNNFGVIHGLSFGMGILTILMYFIIIV